MTRWHVGTDKRINNLVLQNECQDYSQTGASEKPLYMNKRLICQRQDFSHSLTGFSVSFICYSDVDIKTIPISHQMLFGISGQDNYQNSSQK